MSRVARTIATVCVVALAAYCTDRTRLDSQRHYLSTQRYEDTYYVPPEAWLRIFSLGHREALADLLWLRMLVYFGEDMSHRGSSRHLFRYADAIIALNPNFIRAYRWVATTGAYRPNGRGIEDVRKAIEYLERAAQVAPDDGHVAWELGAFYLYDLRPLLKDEAERERAKRVAFDHLKVAVLRRAAPPWMSLNIANLLTDMGERDRQIAYLQQLYEQSSERDREQIMIQLERLKNSSFAEAFVRDHANAEAQRKRDFPYLDLEMFLQVGAKPAYDHLPLLLHGFDPSAVRTAVEGVDTVGDTAPDEAPPDEAPPDEAPPDEATAD
jgi:tetratricopeptide (TPR) repeat protein